MKLKKQVKCCSNSSNNNNNRNKHLNKKQCKFKRNSI